MSSAAYARSLGLTLVSAATTWAALTAWRGFVTYPSAYLLAAGGLALVLALIGALPLPRRTLVPLEVLACLVAVAWVSSGPALPFHGHSPLPVLGRALRAVDTYAVPLDHAQPSITPLLVLGAAAALFLVQWLAVHLGRPPVAGLVLLAVFALPAGFEEAGSPVGSSLGSFVAAAAGFLALLVLDARDHRRRWGRPSGQASGLAGRLAGRLAGGLAGGDTAGRPLGLLASAAPAGVAAIAVAVLVAGILPLPRGGLLGSGGGGQGRVTIHRPVVDMRRDLERGDDIPLVDLTTDEPDPSYLRIAVLNRFTGLEWSSGDRSVSPLHRADGPVPLPPGLSSDVPRTAYEVKVEALAAFASTWLPTDFPVDRVNAPGDWRYDPETMDFIGAGDANTSNTTYSMTSLRLDYGTTGTFFQDAPAGSVPTEDTDVPTSVPTSVRDLALRVTSGARTDYQKALLLQDFFRSTGHFRYSLRRAPGGSLGQSLTTFLSTGPGGRVGYCEQFASAMALMARIVGIPARVAVGFLQPERLGPRRWEYSSHDLHAWPELYFADAGWVRFEPTPATRAPDAPTYSTVPVTVPRRGGSGGSEPSARPGGNRAGEPSAHATATAHPPTPRADAAGHRTHASAGAGLGRALGVLAGLLMLGALLAAPALVRRRRRSRRLQRGPEAAWSEVRATALDLALGWPVGRSPREVAEHLERHLRDPAEPGRPAAGDDMRPATGPAVAQEATAALHVLVDAVEQVRYAAPARAVAVAARTDVATSAATVVRALEAGAGPHARRLARWLPRSLLLRD
jgi:transglutaminase-like putative cysteine protease